MLLTADHFMLAQTLVFFKVITAITVVASQLRAARVAGISGDYVEGSWWLTLFYQLLGVNEYL